MFDSYADTENGAPRRRTWRAAFVGLVLAGILALGLDFYYDTPRSYYADAAARLHSRMTKSEVDAALGQPDYASFNIVGDGGIKLEYYGYRIFGARQPLLVMYASDASRNVYGDSAVIQWCAGSPEPGNCAPVRAADNSIDLSKFVSPVGITIPAGPGFPRGGGVIGQSGRGGVVWEERMWLQGTRPASADLIYTGTVEAGSDGEVGGGTEWFRPARIETSKNPGKEFKIAMFSLDKDGFLVVRDESGASYRIELSNSIGKINELR